ncbi:CBD9-like protein [Mycena venus]|uniref:CBD9-like protein n=1 Tax=Mycena venus TaxID=2733690 RepID=A0A8H6XSD9_9AGAR|nr:CBD9-like protein [Mycena venus]
MPKVAPNVFDYHDKFIVVHAVLACVATLITAPAAILIGRYFRTRRWWFNTHLILQTFTATLIIPSVALGLQSIAHNHHGDQLTGKKADPHHDLGLSILILFLVQFLIGVGAHYTHSEGYTKDSVFPTLTTPKNPLRHIHVMFGIIMTALLYAGVKTGMDEWDDVADNGTLVPKGVRVIYWVLFGLAVAAYFVGWIFEAIPGRGGSRPHSVDAGSTEKAE